MANGHGGRRAGAGRKSKVEKYGAKMDAGDAFVAQRLLKFYGNLDKLADGGVEVVKEVWKPAGMVRVDDLAKDEFGEIVVDHRGKPTKITGSAFPALDPTTLVLVERRTEFTEPNGIANQYLIDRLQGKPTASVEAEIKSDVGDALIEAFGGALTKIYGTSPDAVIYGVPGDSESSGGNSPANCSDDSAAVRG